MCINEDRPLNINYTSNVFNEAKKRGYQSNLTNVSFNKKEKSIVEKVTDTISVVGAVTALAGIAYGAYKIYNNIYVPLRRQYDESRVRNCTPEKERVMDGYIRYRKIFDPNHKRSLVEEAKEAIECGNVEDINVETIVHTSFSSKNHSDDSKQQW